MSEKPVAAGLSVVRARPSLIVVEIAWRWLFGILALGIILIAFRRIANALVVPPEVLSSLADHDLAQSIDALTTIISAALPLLTRTALVVVPVVAILWTLAATAGRAYILSALLAHFASATARPRPLFTLYLLHLLRVASLIIVVGGYFFAAFATSLVIGDLSLPSVLAAVVVFVFIFSIAFAVWSIAHFVVALAPVFAMRNASTTARALTEASSFTRAHTRELFAIASSNGTLRLIAGFAISVAGLIPLLLLGASPVAVSIEVLLALIYCTISDAFLLARLASYVSIVNSGYSTALASGA